MKNFDSLFKEKKITLMGLGLLGRGIGDAAFFASAGANLIVTDLKTETELAGSLERLKGYSNITYHLGGHRLEDFKDRDMILKAAGVPLDSPFIAHARKYHVPVEMDSSLFARLTDATIVGVTGTRGKSTTTHLIYEIAKAAGRAAVLGGNERNVATLQLLKETTAESLAVLELDSWQLQGFEEDRMSPHIAIWTNFMPDHMNYYHGDMDRYFRDKAAIARFQRKEDFFITTPEIKERIETTFGPLSATCITDAAIPNDWIVALPGEHNRKNAALALAAARVLEISDDITKNVLHYFPGLPGRLEFLGEKQGIAFYNDANSTTPEAGIAALRTLGTTGRPIVLIAGGSDKQLRFESFAQEMIRTVKQAVLFEGAATDKLREFLPKTFPLETAANMDEAFRKAVAAARAGDIILLSPAATSFGIFKNEYDRGDQFQTAVEKIG